jgi:hypothetical protein
MGMKSSARYNCEFEAPRPMTEASLRISHRRRLYKPELPITLSHPTDLSLYTLSHPTMASNDNNDKHKVEEEVKFLAARKRLWLFDDDGGDDSTSESEEEMGEEEVSSE